MLFFGLGSGLVNGMLPYQDYLQHTMWGGANGGSYSAGVPRLTGERGPELDFPGMGGQIISNERILEALASIEGGKHINLTQNMNLGNVGDASALPGVLAIERARAGVHY